MDTTNKKPVMLNSCVILELVDTDGGTERIEYILVRSEYADYKAGLLGENTPLGKAIFGRFANEAIPYRVGDLREVRILNVALTESEITSEAADKRRASVKEASNQSEIVSQLIFATAHGSKWGEYDVDVDKLLGNEPNDEEEE